MRFLFFFSLFMILYVYLGYPALAFITGSIRNKKIKKGPYTPLVTVLIAAHNEEMEIEKTLHNKLDLAYPEDKLEVIVISDGSTDLTEKIVEGFKHKGVRLLKQIPRAGKTSALNMAVPQAKGEIIAFSDANSLWEKGALLNLVQNFNDPSVGYVTGKMVYTNPDGSMAGDGCTAYMKYENLLREFETKIGSVVGVDGGIDAIRKSLYQPMNPDQLPDFVLPLKVVRQGYRVVYEPEAVLKEASLKNSSDEYRMRVRVSLRAFWALWDMRALLTFSPVVLFAWQLWSHKVLRYASFIFMSAAYLSNLALWPTGGLYIWLLAAQSLAYLMAVLYPLYPKSILKMYLVRYFLLFNLASCHAAVKFLTGQKQVIWPPRKG
jgi:cellulose synthase/poly-beta-1,6-N-acetylglucosamine synthase-like glycosyltransferase